MKICIVSSCGGHLTEVRALRDAYQDYEHFYVLNERVLLPEDMADKTCFISHAERDWRVAYNLYEAWRILRRERPDVILSTGAGPVVPFAILARLLRIKVVYIETITRIHDLSLTGRLMYRLSDVFYVQWEELMRNLPRARRIELLM